METLKLSKLQHEVVIGIFVGDGALVGKKHKNKYRTCFLLKMV
jgi:hypothetical protein